MKHGHIYDVYIKKPNQLNYSHLKAGEYINYSERAYQDAKNTFQLKLLPKQQTRLYIKHTKYSQYKKSIAVIKKAGKKKQEIIKRNTSTDRKLQFTFILIGLFFSIFTASQFFLYSDKAYLYYSLYLILGTLYFTYRYELDFSVCLIFGEILEWFFLYEPLFTFCLILLYGLFAQSFGVFNEATDLMMKRFLKWLKYAVFAAVIIHSFTGVFFDYATVIFVSNFLKRVLVLFTLPVVVILYRSGSRLSYIFLLGTVILISGAVLAIFKTQIYNIFPATLGIFDSYATMRFVAIIEYFFFATALGYKTKLIQDDKNQAELERNAAELKALRAQLNPHFIFNCLNSIKSLIGKRENEKADEYLQTFTRLARGTLELSEKNYVTLEKELEIADLYVKMEGLRFNDSFHYEVKLSESVEPEAVYVPPLIFQPYLENAIHHGLLPQTGERRLIIKIYRENDSVVCLIDDTGIGRQKANELKTLQHLKRTSFGTRLTQSRIDEYSKLAGADSFSVEIMDKKDEHGITIGTQVKLTFKHQ